MSNPLEFITQTLLAELIIVVVGFLIANYILAFYYKRRYGGWKVIINRGGMALVDREISARKAREVLQEPADLAVFLKGVVSPYGFIHCDLIKERQKPDGVLQVDEEKRTFTIDLDRNAALAPKGDTTRTPY